MYLLRRHRQKDRGQLGVRTQTAANLPLHSRTELPTQRREGIRSLVVEAIAPPRIPPPPYRVDTRAQDHQHRQQRNRHQPPPPGSLRPRTVEKSMVPRRHHQAKKETGSHRRPLLQHQPVGWHISPHRRSQEGISHLRSKLAPQPHRLVASTQLR